jgi:hypothetical protein
VLQKDPNNPFSNQFVKTIYFAKFWDCGTVAKNYQSK